MYNNLISDDTSILNLNNEPVYVMGLPKTVFSDAVSVSLLPHENIMKEEVIIIIIRMKPVSTRFFFLPLFLFIMHSLSKQPLIKKGAEITSAPEIYVCQNNDAKITSKTASSQKTLKNVT